MRGDLAEPLGAAPRGRRLRSWRAAAAPGEPSLVDAGRPGGRGCGRCRRHDAGAAGAATFSARDGAHPLGESTGDAPTPVPARPGRPAAGVPLERCPGHPRVPRAGVPRGRAVLGERGDGGHIAGLAGLAAAPSRELLLASGGDPVLESRPLRRDRVGACSPGGPSAALKRTGAYWTETGVIAPEVLLPPTL